MAIALGIAAVVLAIIGLMEFKLRPGQYDRGRRRAIATLLGCGLLILGMCAGVYAGLKERGTGSGMKFTGRAGEAVVNEAWNFRLQPPAQWSQVEAKRVNALASVAFSRPNPELFFMVMTENLAGAGAMRLDAGIEAIKLNFRGKGTPEFVTDREDKQHGLDGHLLETQTKVGAVPVFYVNWVTQNNGVFYQLVTWGPPWHREQIREASQRFIDGFHFIDPKRVTLPEGGGAEQKFRSLGFGYSVDLTSTVWARRWPNMAQDMPFAEYGIMNPTGTACFTITPVFLGDADLDLDILTHAFLLGLSIPNPDDAIYGGKSWAQGGLSGRALGCERKLGGTEFLYRFRILRQGGYAYLMAAWMDKKSEQSSDFLDAAFDRVVFFAPPSEVLQIVTDAERKRHALLWNAVGVSLERRGEVASALPWYRRAFESYDGDSTVTENYASVALRLGKGSEVLEVFDRRLERQRDNLSLRARRAQLQMQMGDIEGAVDSYRLLVERGWRDLKGFTSYVQELCARGRPETARGAVERYAKGGETNALRRLRAQVLQAGGQHTEAIAILRSVHQGAPAEMETSLALADALFAAQQFTEAIATCDEMIAGGEATAYLYWRKGLAEVSLKRYREAKASFEKGSEKEPANAELRSLVDQVSGMLGEGGNSTVKKEIEPVAIPAELLTPSDTKDASEYLRGFSAWHRHAIRAIAFDKGRELKTTEHQTIQVLDQQGVEKFSTLEFHFDPLSEEIYMNAVTVRDAEGKEIARARVEESYVIDDGKGEAATQRKILHVPVPALRPGHTLEYTVTRRDTGRAETLDFRAHVFAKSLPVLRSMLLVRAPRDAMKWEATPGLPAPKIVDGALTWSVERPPVYRWEPLQAPVESFIPIVWIGDNAATWKGEAKKYLEQIENRLTLDPTMREAGASAISGLEKPAEKAAALARFVQRELTYKAIEFGRRARIPNPTAQIFRNKYGDCKDHALLLCQLLQSAGVPAQLALVNSSTGVREKLPSLDQFAHMIVHVPGQKGGSFIDCTSKSADLRASPPYGLATRQALILDSERPNLATLPPIPDGSAVMTCVRDVTFATETDLEVRETVTFSGVTGTGMRASLQAVEPANRQRHLLHMMTRTLPSLDLRAAEITALDDPQQALVLHLRYLVRGKFQASGGQLIGQLPAIWERMFLAGEAVEQRQTPFKIWVPIQFESRVTVAVPAGWEAKPTEAGKIEGPFFRGTSTARLEKRTLRFEGALSQRVGQFPAREYAAYLDAATAALACLEQTVVLQRP